MRLLSAALAAFVFTANAWGTPPQITPEAGKVLKAVGEFYKGLKSASVEVEQTVMQAIPGEDEKLMKNKYVIAMERPNLFAGHAYGSRGEKLHFICDGKKAWTYVEAPRAEKLVVVGDAPATLDALLREQGEGPLLLLPLGDLRELFLADPQVAILERTSKLTHVGTEKLGDAECVHLRGGWKNGEQREMEWDVWYEKGAKPVLRKFVTSPLKSMLANAKGEARAKLEGARIEIVIEYSAWKLDVASPAGTFKFQPPKDAKILEQPGAPNPAGKD